MSPAVASISVGRHNTFGHPGASTIETLTRYRATVYRTDFCGALSLDVDAEIATTMLPCNPAIYQKKDEAALAMCLHTDSRQPHPSR